MVMSDVDSLKGRVLAEVDKLEDVLTTTSLAIHEDPEVAFKEYNASKLLAEHLKAHGFKLTLPAAGLETGFLAVKKSSPGRRIALLAEYDALPEIGHGCGHNLIAPAALGAGIAVGELITETGGEVAVFGTPAEEGGWGKVNFCEMGAFDDVDVVLTTHPYADAQVWVSGSSTLAVKQLAFAFHGRPTHAAATPHLGINALDAVLQTFSAINALRQHLKDDVRIHGIITDGGKIPNMVPEYARAQFYARSADSKYLEEVIEKLANCARGAALTTGAELKADLSSPMLKNVVNITSLLGIFDSNAESLGLKHLILGGVMPASTDLGNVSQVCPTSVFLFPITEPSIRISFHTTEFAAAAATSLALKNMVSASKLMALMALDVLTNQILCEEARKELNETLGRGSQ